MACRKGADCWQMPFSKMTMFKVKEDFGVLGPTIPTLIRVFPTEWMVGVASPLPHESRICSFHHLEKFPPVDFPPPKVNLPL